MEKIVIALSKFQYVELKNIALSTVKTRQESVKEEGKRCSLAK